MTVSAQTPINRSTGNGVTTVFPYTFKILAESDIEVTVDGVAKTLNVDYTVSGVGSEGGGNVTMTVAPANLSSVVRRRNMALVRTTDYQDQGELPAATLDADIDATVLMVQQVDEQIGRALTLPAGVVGVSAELPEPVGGKLLGWAADGLSIENLDASGVGAGTIGTIQLADGGVTSAKLASGAAVANIGYTPANDTQVAKLGTAAQFTARQRTTPLTDNDLSFDLSAANDFVCTPTAGGTLTFTNITAGCKGEILLVNNSNYTIAKAAAVKCPSTMLTVISATGRYRLAYSSLDGTSVDVTASASLS